MHLGAYAEIGARLRAQEPGFAEILARIAHYAPDLSAIGEDKPPAPRWNQDWFARLDAAIAYVLIRDLSPHRVIEIGSGHSTRFICLAVRDGALTTRFTAIDPAPRATIAGLAIEFRRETLDRAPLSLFDDLGPNDVLFVDSSHVLMPGTDVDVIVNRILPRLAKGVVVHFHDIFLPEPYPETWAWRGYNEQLAVAPLIEGGGYQVLFASRYVATTMVAAIEASGLDRWPLLPGAYESSLWLRKI